MSAIEPRNESTEVQLIQAKARGFAPQCVVFDSWYGSLDNLKLIRGMSWIWLTRLKRNRHVNLDNTKNRPLHEIELAADGIVVHLKGYGFVKVFKIVTPNGDIDYWATNDVRMTPLQRLQFAEFG